MANHITTNVQTVENRPVLIAGSFQMTNANAITSVVGAGVSGITRDSAGVYIITLLETYQSLIAATVTPLVAAATALSGQVEAEAVATAGTRTVTIRLVNDSATETDITDTTTDSTAKVSFMLFLKNSTI
jgi:hypothetical protein